MKTRFYLIEDDPQQSITIERAIKRHFGDVEILLLESESEFYDELDKIPVQGQRPDMVISDVMLPWALPSPQSPPVPEDVRVGTFRKAGVRCWKRFRQRADLKKVPWIYFTVLDDVTINLPAFSDDKTGYVQKAGSVQPLLDAIEKLQGSDTAE